MRAFFLIALVFLCVTPSALAQSEAKKNEKPASLSELLEAVEKKELVREERDAERLRRFIKLKDKREQISLEAARVRIGEEKRSEILQKQYGNNDLTIRSFKESLSRRHGGVKEILGHLTVAAGKSADIFRRSAVSAQFPDRTGFAEKLRLNRFPSIDEIERLWFELQREMVESGRSARFTAPVYDSKGRLKSAQIVRVGGFNVMGGGGFLVYDPQTGQVKTLSRQPKSRFRSAAKKIFKSDSGIVKTAIDPSRGAILSLFVRAPGLGERIDQGGNIGYLIILMGIFGLFLTYARMRDLKRVTGRMQTQAMHSKGEDDNPMGRLMLAYEKNSSAPVDSAEIALAETIRAEKAGFDRFIPFIKFIYVSAPLMGLLGTVVGMIKTFQIISFFGSADPKLLAGGISQALVTTVMGLCVAVPVLLLHTIIKTRCVRATGMLEKKASELMASHGRGDPSA
ncbi:MotA/TolQ/ExbB proton channel family protein [Candidatus Mycalebacterium sp.]